MPHNPRNRDIRAAEHERAQAVTPTDEQITEAMGRAVELRRRTAVQPDQVQATPFSAYEARDLTRGYRTHSWWYRMHHKGPDPWWWIGVLSQVIGDWHRDWHVWLNVDDGRVHLRFQRPWRGDEDECPYP